MKIKITKKLLSVLAAGVSVFAITLPIALTTSCSSSVADKKLVFDQSINFALIYGKDFKQADDDSKGANEIFTNDSKIFAWDVTSTLAKNVLQFLVDPKLNIDSDYTFQGEIISNSVVNNKYSLDVAFKLNKVAIWNDALTIKNIESFSFKMTNATLGLTQVLDVAQPINMTFTPASNISFKYSYFTTDKDGNKTYSETSILPTGSVEFKSNYLTKDQL